MMRLWKTSYVRSSPVATSGMVSGAVHALLISGWIVATRPPSSMSMDSLANRVYYIPPPDKPLSSRGSREAVHYITLGEGAGIGPGPASIDARRPITVPERSATPGAAPVDSATSVPTPPEDKGDSVFTILEVDSAVVRSASSAAPAYPMELLTKRVEGAVVARYVVDTTGFADMESFVVLKSSHEGFIQAVREALPYMRFTPAKIGTRKVRQLVEQSFSFKINPSIVP